MNIFHFLQLWPVLNNLYFVIRHNKARKKKNVSQIFYQLRVKFAFLCFSIKTSLVETLEYFFNMPVMFRHVIQVDKYIIQIDHNTDIQKIRENIVYELLEDCRSISKTKRYYSPFITIGDANQMVSMVKIYLWINLSFVRLSQTSFSLYFYN